MVVQATKNHLGPAKSSENEESINVFQDQYAAPIPGIFIFFSLSNSKKSGVLFVCWFLFVCLGLFGFLINKVKFRSHVQLQEGGSVGILTSLAVSSRVSIHVTKLWMLSCEPGRADRGSEFKFLHAKKILTTEGRIWNWKPDKNDEYMNFHTCIACFLTLRRNNGVGARWTPPDKLGRLS